MNARVAKKIIYSNRRGLRRSAHLVRTALRKLHRKTGWRSRTRLRFTELRLPRFEISGASLGKTEWPITRIIEDNSMKNLENVPSFETYLAQEEFDKNVRDVLVVAGMAPEKTAEMHRFCITSMKMNLSDVVVQEVQIPFVTYPHLKDLQEQLSHELYEDMVKSWEQPQTKYVQAPPWWENAVLGECFEPGPLCLCGHSCDVHRELKESGNFIRHGRCEIWKANGTDCDCQSFWPKDEPLPQVLPPTPRRKIQL